MKRRLAPQKGGVQKTEAPTTKEERPILAILKRAKITQIRLSRIAHPVPPRSSGNSILQEMVAAVLSFHSPYSGVGKSNAWEPPHLCGGRSALALCKGASTGHHAL
jgi:hypothetical protein